MPSNNAHPTHDELNELKVGSVPAQDAVNTPVDGPVPPAGNNPDNDENKGSDE